jgi:hypothetical protein
LNFLLLDADVIIDLHKYGLWKQITKQHKVFIPSIVLHQEVYFYEDEKGIRQTIDLLSQSGKTFTEISADASDLIKFIDQFDAVFQFEVHEGEKEALLLLQENEELIICTCDGAAIKALALLDLAAQGISFQELLEKTGMKKNISYKHSQKRFKKLLEEGTIMRIQDRGIKKKKKR